MALGIFEVREVVERGFAQQDVLDACSRRDLGRVIMILGAHGLTQAVAAQISLLIDQQAAAFGYADVFLLVALLTLISVPLILGIPKPTTTDVVIEVG